MGPKDGLVHVRHQVRQQFVEGSVRGAHVFVAAPEEDGHPRFVGAPGELSNQGGLSLSGLTGDEDELASLSRGHPLRRGVERGQFVLAADDTDARRVTQANG